MTESDKRILKRCEEGHVFDLAKNDVCPICGSAVAGGGDAAKQVENEAADGAKTPAIEETIDNAARRGDPTRSEAGPQTSNSWAGSVNLPSFLSGKRALYAAAGVFAVLVIAAIFVGDGQEAAPNSPQVETDPRVVHLDAPDEDLNSVDDSFNGSTADAYGLWEMFLPVPGNPPQRHVIEIRPNNTYTVYAGTYSHAGRMTFNGRTYLLKSRTSAYEDGGAFFRPDPSTLVFEGRLGRSVWTRVQQPGLFDVSADTGLPLDLSGVLERMQQNVRTTWKADAVPVDLEVERNDHNAYGVEVSFLAPSDGTGLSVRWSRFDESEYEFGGVRWFDRPLPEQFTDLEDAFEALGGRGVIRRASLGYFSRDNSGNTYSRSAPIAWLISSEGGGASGLVDAAL